MLLNVVKEGVWFDGVLVWLRYEIVGSVAHNAGTAMPCGVRCTPIKERPDSNRWNKELPGVRETQLSLLCYGIAFHGCKTLMRVALALTTQPENSA